MPGDGTNELRVRLDRERHGLEQDVGDVLHRKRDEVMEVPADFIELPSHCEQDLAEVLQAALHLTHLDSKNVVVLVDEVAGTLGVRTTSCREFPGWPQPRRSLCGAVCWCGAWYSALYRRCTSFHVYQLRRRTFIWPGVDVGAM